MKKLLVAIPAVAAAAGLLLFLLWQRAAAPPSGAPVRAEAQKPAAEEVDSRGHRVTAPKPPPPPNAPPGLLRLLVTGRGTPLAGAEVQLMRENTAAKNTFTTGPDGIRSVTQIPAGSYVAVVTHPRFLAGEIHVDVPPGGRADATVDLKGGGRIRGRVTDKAGAPLPNTNAMLIEAQGGFTVGPHMSVRTDAQGRYELPPIPLGSWGVRFRHERYRPQDRTGFNVLAGTEEFLADGALETGTRIEGRVVDEQGQPLEGADVTIANLKGGGIATSGADGRFAIYGLSDEPVNGSVSKKGYGTSIRRAIPANSTDLEFRLPKGGAVSGRVLAEPMPEHFYVVMSRYDEELGKPLRVVPKSFTNAPGGAFTVEDLAPGLYWVEVESEEFVPTERPQVSIAAGQTSGGVTIRLQRK